MTCFDHVTHVNNGKQSLLACLVCLLFCLLYLGILKRKFVRMHKSCGLFALFALFAKKKHILSNCEAPQKMKTSITHPIPQEQLFDCFSSVIPGLHLQVIVEQSQGWGHQVLVIVVQSHWDAILGLLVKNSQITTTTPHTKGK